MRNCTDEETEAHIKERFGDYCQEGGFCRVITGQDSDEYQCECLQSWCGPLCSEPCHHPSQNGHASLLAVKLPLIGLVLLLLAVTIILTVYVVIRRRRMAREGRSSGGGGSGIGGGGRDSNAESKKNLTAV